MKIREMSDLHLEFGPLRLENAGEDVLVLAGDIGVAHAGGLWAITQAEKFNIPVVMVAGNHEFYHGWQGYDMEQVYRNLRELSDTTENFHFLQNESVVINGVRFRGTTQWTDFDFNGQADIDMGYASQSMNDYNKIVIRPMQKFFPYDALHEHHKSLNFLEGEFEQEFHGRTVVVTHHGVSGKSIHGKYANDKYNAAYVSNLEDLVEKSNASLWFHGHVHHSFDYMIGNTRVKTNPRGYDKIEINPDWDPNLIVEI